MIANIQVAHYAGMASRDPAFEFAIDVVIASIAPPLPLEVTLLHAVAKVRRAAAASQSGNGTGARGAVRGLPGSSGHCPRWSHYTQTRGAAPQRRRFNAPSVLF